MTTLASVCPMVKLMNANENCTIVHRPNLVKRLQDLEKRLKIPLEERSQCSGELRVAPSINLKAIRVSRSLDAHGRLITDKENTPELHKYLVVTKKDDNAAEVRPHSLLLNVGYLFNKL
jgi:predicted KAP-like P-loop ATPase